MFLVTKIMRHVVHVRLDIMAVSVIIHVPPVRMVSVIKMVESVQTDA